VARQLVVSKAEYAEQGSQDGETSDLNGLSAYTLTYVVANCGTSPTGLSTAWIDYDQDGLFETWEQIIPASTSANNQFTFKVPPSTSDQRVVAGLTQMRVQVQVETSQPPLDPCASFTLGGTKDFSIKIVL